MEQLLEYRQSMIYFYKRFETPIHLGAKFLIGLFLFLRLGTLSMEAMSASKILLVSLACAVLGAVVPPNGFFVLATLAAGIFLSSVSIELALIVMLVFILIILFYTRLFPKEGLLIPAMLLAYYLHIPFAAVLFAGIYFGIMGIIPVAIATFLWLSIPYLPELVQCAPKAEFALLSMPDSFIKMFNVFTKMLEVKPIFISTLVVFLITVIVTSIIAHLKMNYARQTAIATGGLIMLFGFLIVWALGKTNFGILEIILGGIVSCIIIFIIQFFELALDYSNTENVEFEDSEFYYYVKIVPKYLVDTASNNIQERASANNRQRRFAQEYEDPEK